MALRGRLTVYGYKGVVDKHLCRLFRTVQIAAGHLRTGYPQLAHRSHGQPMPVGIDHVQAYIVQRLADGHVSVLLLDGIDGDDDGGLRGSVAVIELIAAGRSHTGQLLTAASHVEQGVVFDGRGKLVGHLCGDEGIGDMLLFEILVHANQVQAHLLGNDIHRGTTRQRWPDALLVYVEAVAGIACHAVLGLQLIVLPVPVAVAHQVRVRQLATLGHTRRARGIKQDEEAVGLRQLIIDN